MRTDRTGTGRAFPTGRIAIALSVALQLGLGGAALAAGRPVELGKTQMTLQDQQTHVLNLLSAQGYKDVGPLQQTGKSWMTTASKNGKSMRLVIDPAAGTVKVS